MTGIRSTGPKGTATVQAPHQPQAPKPPQAAQASPAETPRADAFGKSDRAADRPAPAAQGALTGASGEAPRTVLGALLAGKAAPSNPPLDSVLGQRDEADMRRGLETLHGGKLNRAAGIAEDVLSLVGVRLNAPRLNHPAIQDLPSFKIDAKDGTWVDVKLDLIKDKDGVERGGVTLDFKPMGESGRRFRWAEGMSEPQFGGLMDERPLSVRHAFVARVTLDAISRHLDAAAAPGAPLGPGATGDEVRRAQGIAAKLDASVRGVEELVQRSPSAKLVAQVWAGLSTGELRADADVEKAIATLTSAPAALDRETHLSSQERALLRDELKMLKKAAVEWMGDGARTYDGY